VSSETVQTVRTIESAARPQSAFLSTVRRVFASQEGVLLLIVVGLWLYLSYRSDVFFTERNIGVMLSQVSMIAITGVGMTMLLIAREVDLSVGSLQAFAGVVAMQALNETTSLLIGVAVALLVGAAVGAVNAGATLGLKISSFIVTLAMMQIIRGLAYTSTNAAVQNDHKLTSFRQVFNGATIENPIRIPNPVLIMIVIFIVFGLILGRTSFGRSIYAIGGNPQAAALSGIPVNRIKAACFIITGVLASLSAFMLISRMNSGQNNAGFGFELQVIGSVLLGGASLAGGKGTLVGTLLAAILLGTVNNGIILLGYNSNWQTAVVGLMILFAVLLDTIRRRFTGEG
jgi:ribose/xylose/arabinose/galactoside ABC-type transport system permease subunit